jgi:isoquinoline 1-oxidoreductase beta subunit
VSAAGFGSDDSVRALMHAIEDESAAIDVGRLGRRTFLKIAGLAGGGLVLGLYLGPSRAVARTGEKDASAKSAPKELAPNAYLRIGSDDSVLIYSKSPEIGQGIKTAFALIVAEELDADWTRVRVEQAPIKPSVYGRQSAGGSRSIPMAWDELRRAGATARAMLVQAAAKRWEIAPEQCSTERGVVSERGGSRRASYGELASAAAELPVPEASSLVLKKREEYRLLGTRVTGVDNRKLVTGEPLFGIDQSVPGMLHAVFEKCPAPGGRVREANLDEIAKLPGVVRAFALEGTGRVNEVMPGVAIVARSTWAALEARKQLRVTWDESQAAKDSWSASLARAEELAKQPGAEKLRETGEIDAAFERAKKRVEGFYVYPFVAHAPLEPQNTTASYRDGAVEVWAPTQTPDRALGDVARVLGIPVDRVTIHQTRAGGGFGRRLINDPICEAAAISKQMNAPIKLQWTREDDMAHDFYRVGGFHALRGAVDKQGRLVAWQDHFISFSSDGKEPVSGGNIDAAEFPALLLENFRLTQTLLPLQTPCGPWRAPRSNAIAFAVQSFLHELSAAARRDHRDFLLELLGEPRWLKPGDPYSLHTGRAAGVIRLACEKAGWGKKLPRGSALGLAFHFSHAGHFAEVAEVSVGKDKKLTVHRVTVAGDIGPLINRSGAENQCEGAVIDGLSTMLSLELSLENGRITPGNFDAYPLLRLPHAPPVDVHFIESDFSPTGVGEPALPPVAPAICNAIFAATGERVRRLPLARSGYSV